MDKPAAIAVFEALSHPHRLEVFRLLVRHTPDGLVAGEIAAALGLPASNLSFHLKDMAHAGLIAVTAEGRYQRCRANIGLVGELVVFLTEDCCAGHPELCLPQGPTPPGSVRTCCPASETEST